jgi:hypothetical protein
MSVTVLELLSVLVWQNFCCKCSLLNPRIDEISQSAMEG